MTKGFYAVVLVTAMLLSVPAAAGNTQGPGAVDCGQWLDRRKADDYHDEYCLDNPSNYLFDAANAFIYRER